MSQREKLAEDSRKVVTQNINKLNCRAEELITWFEDNNKRAEELNKEERTSEANNLLSLVGTQFMKDMKRVLNDILYVS